MNRRCFLASLGILAASPLCAQPASVRVYTRHFEGEMSIAGNSTPLSLKLVTTSGRSRLVTGHIWLGGGVGDLHEISGRFSRDRKRLSFFAGLPNNREIRFEGKFTDRGTLLAGRVKTYANGAPVAGGTFSIQENLTPPPPPQS